MSGTDAVNRVRQICLALPGATEKVSHGELAWFVGGRQFANIADYNEAAGEVAEPFRFVVVANFPANFTPEAGRRLLSRLTL